MSHCSFLFTNNIMKSTILKHSAANNSMLSHKCSCDSSPIKKIAAWTNKNNNNPK